jgi:hypothetical protein
MALSNRLKTRSDFAIGLISSPRSEQDIKRKRRPSNDRVARNKTEKKTVLSTPWEQDSGALHSKRSKALPNPGSPALLVKTALRRSGTPENPLENEDRRAGCCSESPKVRENPNQRSVPDCASRSAVRRMNVVISVCARATARMMMALSAARTRNATRLLASTAGRGMAFSFLYTFKADVRTASESRPCERSHRGICRVKITYSANCRPRVATTPAQPPMALAGKLPVKGRPHGARGTTSRRSAVPVRSHV